MPLDIDTLYRSHESDADFDFIPVRRRSEKPPRLIPTKKTVEEWTEMFQDMVSEDPLKPQALITFEIIQKSLQLDDSTTTQELMGKIRFVRNALEKAPSTDITVEAAGELFTRLITRYAAEIECVKEFSDVREKFISRGSKVIEAGYNSPHVISKFAQGIFKGFDVDNHNSHLICVDGWNPTIFQILVDGYKICPDLTVHVMESAPMRHGIKMGQELKKAGVPCKVFSDSALSMAVAGCHIVFCNARGITPESQFYVRSNTISLIHMAERYKVPVHLTCEFYKMAKTVDDEYKWAPDDQFGCLEIPDEEWTPGMPVKFSSPESKAPDMRMLPATQFQTVYTDLGRLTSSLVFENFNILFT